MEGDSQEDMTFIQYLFVLFAMLFCHLIDDFRLQGILANMKQYNWWRKNAPHPLYRNDYIMALIEHSFSWSFSISVPLLVVAFIQKNDILLAFCIGSYFVNTPIHAFVDNLKANEYKINLIQDQLAHLLQIGVMWLIGIFLI